MPRMSRLPDPAVPLAALSLLAVVAGALPAAAAADPYQIEVLVFERPVDPAAPPDATDHRPGCLARAQPPATSAGTPAAAVAVGAERFQLTAEAQALRRSGAGLRVLSHTAWHQEVSATASGPWVRIGGAAGAGLIGCLRARLTPVPEVEIDLIREDATGDLYPLSRTARIRPGDVHYFDHPALGALVRVDSLAAPAAGTPAEEGQGAPAAVTAPATPPPRGTAAPPAPQGTTASPGAPEAPPPPPKKPFRW